MKIQWTRELQDEALHFFDMRTIAANMNLITLQFVDGAILPVSLEHLSNMADKANEKTTAEGHSLSEVAKGIEELTGKKFSSDEVIKRLAACLLISGISHTNIMRDAYYGYHFMANLGFFTQKQMEQNPYYRDIHISEVRVGNVRIGMEENPQNSVILYNNATLLEYGIHVPSLGMMETAIRYPAFEKDDKVWMSVDPQEITTMQEGIDRAHGKVLTLGCGMGYFAYMASLKDNVESVTIVELDSEVIEMFTTHILPQMKTKDKIRIVQADAIRFMKNLEDGQYDYCYADIWRGPMDWKVYLNLRNICNRFKQMEVQYWLEPNMNIHVLDNFVYWLRNRLIKAIPGDARSVMMLYPTPDRDGLFPLWDEMYRKYTIYTPKDLQALCSIGHLVDMLNDKKLGKYLAAAKLKI